MRLTAGALAALALAVLGLLLAVDAASRVGSDGLAVTVMLVAAGGSAVVAGAMAALHRPDSAFGVLLEAAGCLWFVSEWNSPTAGSAMVFTVGLICWAAFPIVAAHAALAFPSGRLVSPVDRLLIIAGYAVFVGLIGLVPTLVFDPVAQGCRACAGNLVLVTSSPALVGVFGGWGAGCAVLVATSLAVLGVVRLVRSTPAARRMKSVVLGPSVLLLLAVAITFVRAVNPATVPQDQLSRVLWWVQAAALTALSAGVVVDWIRLRRARSRIASFVIALGVGGAPVISGPRSPQRCMIPPSTWPIRWPTAGWSALPASRHRPRTTIGRRPPWSAATAPSP